jgi:hypothetical protein
VQSRSVTERGNKPMTERGLKHSCSGTPPKEPPNRQQIDSRLVGYSTVHSFRYSTVPAQIANHQNKSVHLRFFNFINAPLSSSSVCTGSSLPVSLPHLTRSSILCITRLGVSDFWGSSKGGNSSRKAHSGWRLSDVGVALGRLFC